MTALLTLAFGAGLLAPINPCGFAVLPAMLAYTTTGEAHTRTGLGTRLASGLRAGGALSLGFAGTITLIGLLLAAGLRSVTAAVPWLAAALGAVLALTGLAMLATGRTLPLRVPTRRGTTVGSGPRGMVGFGAGYALASASCTVAVLIAVVTQALASASLGGLVVVFAAYAAGSTTLLLTLAVFAALGSGLISRYLTRLLPHLPRLTGAVLAASGGYLLAYWLPGLLGSNPMPNSAFTAVVATISAWISAHQLAVVLAALAILAAATLAAVILRRTTPAPAEDCCPPATGETEQHRRDPSAASNSHPDS
ncbi:cytochrome c biogenesis protein CcdA [Saccharopolyspora sp. ID03-671]|uniref:cytochrome c biogenesis CcdA family protein n=1 Tax=Saccharopolyspora sp. ID03-671 TaxID=3073066 RepID=UPI0032448C12